ncbi:hypothetical protein C9374_000450 [Naegleria lovaniensis]|uniref:Uncharacterized protein n=1 Tax=Naegleria lovaniensis TaxID=51637 RepID=A0AA88KP49_NAELO|nr:uncharacterized protein C9374_000450 [Naegleria lovaniensis]KAG2388286.1 hypothetical protein C9374_000450 [Naegleria lovaniensis]
MNSSSFNARQGDDKKFNRFCVFIDAANKSIEENHNDSVSSQVNNTSKFVRRIEEQPASASSSTLTSPSVPAEQHQQSKGNKRRSRNDDEEEVTCEDEDMLQLESDSDDDSEDEDFLDDYTTEEEGYESNGTEKIVTRSKLQKFEPRCKKSKPSNEVQDSEDEEDEKDAGMCNIIPILRLSADFVPGELENIDNVPPLTKYIQMRRPSVKPPQASDNNSVHASPSTEPPPVRCFVMDAGSSYCKAGMILIHPNDLPIVKPIRFGEGEFLPSTLYYSPSSRLFMVGLEETDLQKKAPGFFPIPNVKKLHTIYESGTYSTTMNGEQVMFHVSDLIYQFTKCCLNKMRLSRDGSSGNIALKFEHAIFTIPTETSDTIKLIYRNAVKKAIDESFEHPIKIENILIVEEALLLKYAAEETCSLEKHSSQVTVIVDPGHLTTDIAVVMGNVLLDMSREVAGAGLIYNMLRNKHNMDPEQIMKDVFNDAVNPYEALKYVTEDIIREFQRIVNAVFDTIIEFNASLVVFCGAIMNQQYFLDIIKELVQPSKLNDFIHDNIRFRYIKEEHRSKNYTFTFQSVKSHQSSLILGAYGLVKESVMRSQEEPIPIMFLSKQIAQRQYFGGLLYLKDEKEYGIAVSDCVYDLYARQDIELFIVGLRNIYNAEQIRKDGISKHNFEKVGIAQLIRFSTLEVLFDYKNFVISCPKMYIQTKVDPEAFALTFWYTRGRSTFKSNLLIDRKGRIETVPINEAGDYLFEKEDETLTWFGVEYDCSFLIRGINSRYVTKTHIKANEQWSEVALEELTPNYGNHYAIPFINEGVDKSQVDKILNSEKCVVCAKAAPNPTMRVSVTNILKVSQALNFDISSGPKYGPLCNTCNSTYLSNRRRKNKKK